MATPRETNNIGRRWGLGRHFICNVEFFLRRIFSCVIYINKIPHNLNVPIHKTFTTPLQTGLNSVQRDQQQTPMKGTYLQKDSAGLHGYINRWVFSLTAPCNIAFFRNLPSFLTSYNSDLRGWAGELESHIGFSILNPFYHLPESNCSYSTQIIIWCCGKEVHCPFGRLELLPGGCWQGWYFPACLASRWSHVTGPHQRGKGIQNLEIPN